MNENKFPEVSDSDVEWEYNGKTYVLDLFDDDINTHFIKCCADVAESKSKTLQGHYAAVKTFFDNLFGAGSGVDILGGKANMRLILNAQNSLKAFAKAQRAKLDAAMAFAAS